MNYIHIIGYNSSSYLPKSFVSHTFQIRLSRHTVLYSFIDSETFSLLSLIDKASRQRQLEESPMAGQSSVENKFIAFATTIGHVIANVFHSREPCTLLG